MVTIPMEGFIGDEMAQKVHAWWLEAAERVNQGLADFNPAGSFEERVNWAKAAGLDIGTGYARFSTKMQNSTEDQLRAIVSYAAQHKIYVPPELLSADEGVKGRRIRRDGLTRMTLILRDRLASVLLVFKVSRLFRQAVEGYLLFQHELVEEGLRGISISQGIDTNNTRTWKSLTLIHGMADDMLIDATGDHVREGLKGLFREGYSIGPPTLGFRRVEVPGGRVTKRRLPRMKDEIDPELGPAILQHFQWINDGMPIAEGWRRWNAAYKAHDSRSTLGYLSPEAYRRMLSNQRYTGHFEYGRKRGRWSSKRDYCVQETQPDDAVEIRKDENLRIVSDDLFWAVQKRLQEQPRGRHKQRKKERPLELHHLVTDVFWCPHCDRRFQQCGSNGGSMQCTNDHCPQRGCIRRKDAVATVCEKLEEILKADTDLIDRIIAATQTLDAETQTVQPAALDELKRQIERLGHKLAALRELAGEGSAQDQAETKSKIISLQQERASVAADLSRMTEAANRPRQTISRDEALKIIENFKSVLQQAAAGTLGNDVIYNAAQVFRQMVGGKVMVDIIRRPGRKRTTARGHFAPAILRTALQSIGKPSRTAEEPRAIEFWFRKPPRLDMMAEEVRRLYEDEGLGLFEIGERLQCGAGNASQAWRRWYEMRGLPAPAPRNPTGRPRKSA